MSLQSLDTNKSRKTVDKLLSDDVKFPLSIIIGSLRRSQRIGALKGLEIGSAAPASLAGILDCFTERTLSSAIECAYETNSSVIQLRHLQLVVLLEDFLNEFVYNA